MGYYHYLNQGNSPYIDGVDDLTAFEETCNALTLLGFTETEQGEIFKILTSILKLGNIKFVESDNNQEVEGCDIYVSRMLYL